MGLSGVTGDSSGAGAAAGRQTGRWHGHRRVSLARGAAECRLSETVGGTGAYRWGHATKERILKHLIHRPVHLIHLVEHLRERISRATVWKHGCVKEGLHTADTERQQSITLMMLWPCLSLRACKFRRGFATLVNSALQKLVIAPHKARAKAWAGAHWLGHLQCARLATHCVSHTPLVPEQRQASLGTVNDKSKKAAQPAGDRRCWICTGAWPDKTNLTAC